jgi:hypothetical protein
VKAKENAMPRLLTACLLLTLAGCTSTPPKPPVADGEIVPANGPQALEELVRAAVAAANPQAQRFAATRGESLRDVLIRWSQQDKSRLFYRTTHNPILTGAINEPDLRAAAVSLSILMQHESKGLLMDFSQAGSLIVREHKQD